jgi:hypothetical protein
LTLPKSDSDHFQGKNPLEHLFEARKKGRIATAEIHGNELSGFKHALGHAIKETTFVLSFLALYLIYVEKPLHPLIIPLGLGWLVWKTGRSALLGWARLERLHRLIEEERFEIEHHRDQEKQELRALYEAKGLTPPLLDEVVTILMADDNRLLEIMLEEELGLQVESFEHPLRQAMGAFLGSFLALIVFSLVYLTLPLWVCFVVGTVIVATSSVTIAFWQHNRRFPAAIWNVGLYILSLSVARQLMELVAG